MTQAALVGAAGALAMVIGATPALAADTAGWYADGYGPGNTSFNPDEKKINKNNLKNLKHKFSVRRTNSCQNLRPPVVDGDRMFAITGDGVAAYNATSGAQLWKYTWEDAPFEEITLTVASGLVIVSRLDCGSQSDPYGAVIALNAVTGVKVWSVGPSANEFSVGPPHQTVVDKNVVVLSGEDSDGLTTVGLRLSDGAALWSRGGHGKLMGPVSANGLLLVTIPAEPGRPAFSELADIATGATLHIWDKPYEARATSPNGKFFYAVDGSDLVRLNATTHKENWRIPGPVTAVSADSTRVYVSSGNTLRVFNAVSGAPIWTQTTAGVLGKPVIAGGVVYVRSISTLAAFAAGDGTPVDTGRSYTGFINHPVVANGKLYLTNGEVLDAYAH